MPASGSPAITFIRLPVNPRANDNALHVTNRAEATDPIAPSSNTTTSDKSKKKRHR